jgi:DNA processing protein
MSVNLRYWLWIQRALGEGFCISKLIDAFGSADGFYNASILDWKISGVLTEKQINSAGNTKLEEVDEIIYSCEQNGWQIIDYDDARYPERLRQIYNPPAVLYVDGTLPDIDRYVTIGIVGTRRASEYAVKVTHIMSRGITEAGAIVVSGGALGVDTYAHRGAITAGGKTVAVLGCGLGSNYLQSNRELRDLIRMNGALVTEYPPFTSASKTTFPMRNRLISGLSLGVLVVEAGVKSGSLITARFALEQNRDVYAVPASVLSTDFAGSNRLIDEGATVVTKPEQLLYSYESMFDTVDLSKIRSIDELMYDESDKSVNVEEDKDKYSFEKLEAGRRRRAERQEAYSALTGDLKKVCDSLSESYEHIDVIIERSGLPNAKVLASLTQLEILGVCESASGKRYKLS